MFTMNIFSIAPPRLGGVDMLIPLFIELKSQDPDTNIELVFFEQKSWQDLKYDKFLSYEVSRTVDTITHMVSEKKNKFIVLIRFFFLLIRIVLSKNPILLHSRTLADRKLNILSRIIKIKHGKIFKHFSGMTLMLGRVNKKQKLIEKNDVFLSFSVLDNPYLNSQGYTNIIPIGYPRLYLSWLKEIKIKGPEFVNNELLQLEINTKSAIIGVFLPSTLEGVFDVSEFEVWMSDVISCVNHVYLNAVIVLKPHPMLKPGQLEPFLKKNVYITQLHVAVVASASKVIISHHSSTIIDSLSINVPTIQYQNFTPHWLERHPEGSAFLKLKPLTATNVSELEAVLESVLENGWNVSDIVSILKHKENVGILFNNK